MELRNLVQSTLRLIGAAVVGLAVTGAAPAAELSRTEILALSNDEALMARHMPFYAGRASDEARYVTLSDGTRIALFFHFPEGFDRASSKVPVAFEETIYGHHEEVTTTAVDLYRGAGFAVVVADARGTGASYGTQQWDHATDRKDAREIIAWIAAQPWSSGTIAPIGLSISGTYADLITGLGLPEVKAAAIRSADFDHYTDNVFPGGVPNRRILGLVGELIEWYAGGECAAKIEACATLGFQPVDGDTDFALLQGAVKEHAANLHAAAFANLVYRDDRLAAGTLTDYSSISDRAAVDAAKIPARVSASWTDGTTADGALRRFNEAPDTPVSLVIGATTHPGGLDADPFALTPFGDARPNGVAQFQADVDFVKAALAGETVERRVSYLVLGADVWKTSTVWPPASVKPVTLNLAPGQLVPGSAAAGSVAYSVDPASTFGPLDRWGSQKGGRIFYGDLRTAPGRRLEFTADPVAADMELVGAAELCLVMSSDQPDGLVIAYLEDVAPDGRVTYLTEGLLRLLHRKTEGAQCDPAPGTKRSFARVDGAPVVPGETMTIELPFLQTAALIRKGHAVRLALAGADMENFDTLTGDALANWSVAFGGTDGSRLTLPLRPWQDE